MTAALGALLLSAVAGTASADAAERKQTKRHPVVTSVRPMDAKVGEIITLGGRNFVRGKDRNTVVFKRDGARAVFVKSTLATAKQIRVLVPDSLREFLPDNTSARFRLRVLSRRFSKRFTSSSRSPMITALPRAATPGSGAPGAAAAPGGSAGGAPAPAAPSNCGGDEDGDLLDASLENELGLNACKADSDDDGVPDGYEYQSARDLNDGEQQEPNTYLPYPGKRNYPNPLDKDAGVDHDGDTLTLLEEYRLWLYTLGGRTPTASDLASPTYSAGEQYSIYDRDGSGRRRPALAADGYAKQGDFLAWAAGAGYDQVGLSDLADEWYEPRTPYDIRDSDRSGGAAGTVPAGAAYAPEVRYYDFNDDGWLSDAERDEDADGLTNFDETRGCGVRTYWNELYDKETPYYIGDYGVLQHDDFDSDGDGVRDGADDLDHDDIPNTMECSRNMASGDPEDPRPTDADPPAHPAESFVNPFNPCLPHVRSRTCNRFPSLSSPWAPFNAEDTYFYVWN